MNITIAEFNTYVTDRRWQMYFTQLENVLALKPRKIVELGVGYKVLYAVMKSRGFQVTGFDNTADLKPDAVGDVRKLGRYFQPNSFDLVCCFQLLEHLPYEDFGHCLKQISEVTEKYALISLPYTGITMRAHIAVARYGNREIRICKRIPFFWRKYIPKGDHKWETGWREYPLSRIEGELENHFLIRKRLFVKPNDADVMYVLERK